MRIGISRPGNGAPSYDRERRRITRLPKVDADHVTVRCRGLAVEFRSRGAIEVINGLPRHAAAVRAPARDRQRKHEVVMPALSRVKGQVARRAESHAVILKFAD